MAPSLLQSGHVAPSVADILHLEKRWDKLPGANAGAVALEDAKSLLGSEVLAVSSTCILPGLQLTQVLSFCLNGWYEFLFSPGQTSPPPRHPLCCTMAAAAHDGDCACLPPLLANLCPVVGPCIPAPTTTYAAPVQGDPLELVVQQVLAAQGLPSAPQLLTKRQFVSLAHVAELVQSRAFDMLTAEEAAAPRTEPQGASNKKRPPPIRDAHLDTWRIAAAPAGATGAPDGDPDDAEPQEDAAAGQVDAGATAGLSRATSVVPGGALLAAASEDRPEECDEEGAATPQEQAGRAHASPVDAEVDAFTTQLNVSGERRSVCPVCGV